jgi:hypothetical protein
MSCGVGRRKARPTLVAARVACATRLENLFRNFQKINDQQYVGWALLTRT